MSLMPSTAARRPRKPLYHLLTPLVLAALACSFGQPLAPTHAPVATRTPLPEASATAESTALPASTLAPTVTPAAEGTAAPVAAVSLLDEVLARIRSGEWERGAAIAAGLGYVLGETNADEAFGPQTVIKEESATGLIRMGQHYLETGGDPAAQAEIERLLNLLLPPLELLDQFAQPAPAAAGVVSAGGQARPFARPVGDEALCAALWADGFPASSTTICFEYATRTIGGQEHRVYYPAYWPADDPRREYLTLYVEALEASLAVFNGYGPAPVKPVVMVFTELAALTRRGRDEAVYAAAGGSPSTPCRMGVFPAAAAQAPAAFQQTIAHELFHCYQHTNLTAQERGPNPDDNAWWVEGSAEFFGNIVYPAVNDEWQFVGDFDRQSTGNSLLSITYPNFLWFQYLAHNAGLGTEGVLALLRSMPTAGGAAQQEAALAAYPGMEDLFHNFARAYLDRALLDTDGSVLPVNPRPGPTFTFAIGGGEESVSPLPFFVARVQMQWQEAASFALTVATTGGAGRSAVRDPGTPGLWTALPDSVGTACAGEAHLLLVTTTEAGDADPHELRVAYTGEEAADCDDCLVGTWALDNGSYIHFLNGLPGRADAIEYTSATGTTLFNFKDDGVASTQHEGFVVEGVIHQETLDGGALDLPLQMALSGGSETNYAAEAGTLTFSGGEYNVVADMTMNGLRLTDFEFNEEDFGLGAGEARYTCIGDSVTYRPIFPTAETTRSMDFVRVETP
jgi:hypothetical protein